MNDGSPRMGSIEAETGQSSSHSQSYRHRTLEPSSISPFGKLTTWQGWSHKRAAVERDPEQEDCIVISLLVLQECPTFTTS